MESVVLKLIEVPNHPEMNSSIYVPGIQSVFPEKTDPWWNKSANKKPAQHQHPRTLASSMAFWSTFFSSDLLASFLASNVAKRVACGEIGQHQAFDMLGTPTIKKSSSHCPASSLAALIAWQIVSFCRVKVVAKLPRAPSEQVSNGTDERPSHMVQNLQQSIKTMGSCPPVSSKSMWTQNRDCIWLYIVYACWIPKLLIRFRAKMKDSWRIVEPVWDICFIGLLFGLRSGFQGRLLVNLHSTTHLMAPLPGFNHFFFMVEPPRIIF